MAIRQEREFNAAQVMQVWVGTASIASFTNLTSFTPQRTPNSTMN